MPYPRSGVNLETQESELEPRCSDALSMLHLCSGLPQMKTREGAGRGSPGKRLGQDSPSQCLRVSTRVWVRVRPTSATLHSQLSYFSELNASVTSAPCWLSRNLSLDLTCVLESLTPPAHDLDALIRLTYLLSTCYGPRAKNPVVK